MYYTCNELDKLQKFNPLLILGCTAGIGNAFVNELASRGLNIILISRNEAALEEKSQ